MRILVLQAIEREAPDGIIRWRQTSFARPR